jgi:hypothetical protein
MKVITIILLAITVSSCERQLYKSYNVSLADQLYARAINQTVDINKERIANNLVSISLDSSKLVWKDFAGKSYVLTVMWKKASDTQYYKNDCNTGFCNTKNYYNFVTIVPELKSLCREKRFGVKEGVNLRLEQLLGLSPKSEKNYFIQVWVRPKDLIRPCRDTEITDRTCGLEFEDSTVTEYNEYLKWLRDYNVGYPFTQLGYTYDWNKRNKSHQGLSEFLINKNSEIVVKDFIETIDYCYVRDIKK